MVTVDNTLAWLKEFAGVVEENKAYLSDLDTPIGDGDHGNNMSRGVQAMLVQFNDKSFNSVSEIFKTTAMALMGNIGGASGPLYGSAFMEMAKKSAETDDISQIIKAGLEGIKKRGKAETGEKTMIDVWQPVSEALMAHTLTPDIIEQAVLSTQPLVATKGRASYVGERSVGHIDPGSTSSGYLFTAMLRHISV